jgi:hypothetical protein
LWEETVKSARKEGTVSVYFWQGGNLDKVLQVFQQKFPDIRLAAVGGRGSGFINRIVAEMRAGKHLVDVCICGENGAKRQWRFSSRSFGHHTKAASISRSPGILQPLIRRTTNTIEGKSWPNQNNANRFSN